MSWNKSQRLDASMPCHEYFSLFNIAFIHARMTSHQIATWRPAGCWRGRSRSSRGAPPPPASTWAPTNTRCSSWSDGQLTPDRRATLAGRSNVVSSSDRSGLTWFLICNKIMRAGESCWPNSPQRMRRCRHCSVIAILFNKLIADASSSAAPASASASASHQPPS